MAAQVVQRALHRGQLLVQLPVAAPLAGKMARESQDPVAAAVVQAADESFGVLAGPPAVAPESRSRQPALHEAGRTDDIQIRAEQQVNAYGAQFLPQNGAYRLRKGRIPRGAQRQLTGPRRKSVAQGSFELPLFAERRTYPERQADLRCQPRRGQALGRAPVSRGRGIPGRQVKSVGRGLQLID